MQYPTGRSLFFFNVSSRGSWARKADDEIFDFVKDIRPVRSKYTSKCACDSRLVACEATGPCKLHSIRGLVYNIDRTATTSMNGIYTANVVLWLENEIAGATFMNENSATRRKSEPGDFRDGQIPTKKARESSLPKSARD